MAKVLQTLRKKAQATPIVGVILDSLKSDNPTQNAPSIQAVLDNLQPKQLLINPDFQVWQRGENLSITDLSGSGGVYYHVDMWCTYNNDNSFKISKVENGTKVICTGRHTIMQRFDSPLKVGEKYILLAKVEGEIIKLNIIGGTYSSPNAEDPKTSLFYRKISSGKEEIGIYLKENFNGIIEYVDLWEGDIVYPHVKNKYAYDLMECQHKIFVITNITGMVNGSAKNLYTAIQQNLDNNPNVVVESGEVYIDGFFNSHVTNIVSQNWVKNGSIELVIKFQDATENGKAGRFTNGKIILSCELL